MSWRRPTGPEGTPLHRAESADEVDRLLGAGRCAVDAPGWMGATPLHSAAERGLADVVGALLRHGADVAARRPERRETPLHFAATGPAARLLLDAGAEPEPVDWVGRTPLHWAAQFGRPDVIDELLRAGADPDRPAKDGKTPLHWAAQEGHPAALDRLLTIGVRVAPRDRDGRTPLQEAARRGQVAALAALLRAGANPDERADDGRTPLHEATRAGHTAVVALLEATAGPVGRTGRPAPGPPGEESSGLLAIRTHPVRPEAVTIAPRAILHRWILGRSARVEAKVQAPDAGFVALAVAPSGGLIACASEGGAVELRRWEDLRVVDRLDWPSADPAGVERCAAQSLDLSPDGRWLALADSHEQLHLIDRSTGRVVATTEAGQWTCSMRFDPTSRWLATACSGQGGGLVRVDQVDEGRFVPIVELVRGGRGDSGGLTIELARRASALIGRERPDRAGFVDTLASLAFSPAGQSLALFETSAIGHGSRPPGWRGDLVMFDVATWAVRWLVAIDHRRTGDRRGLTEAGHGMGFVTEVLFLDDETVACGATLGWVLFYRVADGALARRIQVHPSAPVVALAREVSTGAVWAALGRGGGPPVRVPNEPRPVPR